ncbi:hypothetical protein D3C85_273240 [compost metagenome]
MQISLEQQASVLSMEAFNLRASLTALTRVFPQYARGIGDTITSYLANDQMLIPLVKVDKKANIAKSVDYSAHRKTAIYGPAGLTTTYLNYLGAVEASVTLAKEVYHGQLVPFNAWLGNLLGDPEALSSIAVKQDVLKFDDSDIEKCKKGLEKCVNRASSQTKHEYGKLVKQNAEWDEILSKTNQMVVSYQTVNRTEVLNQVDTLNEQLLKLAQRIQEDPDTYKASGITIAELAKRCLVVARSVEFYSITGYLMTELSSTVQASVDALKRL